ncbi:hypothetical protein IP92_05747 [Pseudoduganella flava]|uniref:Injection protein n=1 Tax=Pseudoduganella flava TaxID=871742 RepID=A0A562P993_9BURK|nr:DUF885 domain-containing protein [Pseudoduganella flava]QGZ42720.1 hypothetical protein GO485_29255 [Pseudoduganella flava]TWI41027.1 hypothetical protein IP92_05747 [Pseudoduganella flava]
MAGPWEKFAAAETEAATGDSGPWSKFQSTAAPARPAAAPLSRIDKVLKGVRDPIDAGAQLLTHILPEGVVNAGNRLNNYIADKTGLVARIPEGGVSDLVQGGSGVGGVDRMIADAEKAYQARRAAAGESGFDGYRTIGNMVSPANLAVASRLPAAATLAGRIGVGALGGGVSGALTPVAGGDFVDEKVKQIGAGALVGGAIPAITGGLARMVSPNASKNANLQLLRREGVQPTIGQALGGRANAVEEKLMSLPVVGDMVSKARGAANDQFQRAAINRALKPIGAELPEGMSGRDAVTFTENALKERYDDVLNKIGAIPADGKFTSNVAALRDKVNKMLIPADEKAKFQGALSDVLETFDEHGYMTSDAYKTLESALGADARKLAGSQSIYEGKLAPAVKQLQAELRDMLKRQAGEYADDLKASNTGWANFKRVQNAASKLGADDGNFTPAQFQNAVRALDKSKDKGAFARGSALGQDLGDAGKSVLGNKVPNSGTTDRALLNLGLLGGTAAVSPAAAMGALGGAAMYTSPAQRALVAAVSARPASAQQAAELLRKTAPYTLGASGQLGLGLLNQ